MVDLFQNRKLINRFHLLNLKDLFRLKKQCAHTDPVEFPEVSPSILARDFKGYRELETMFSCTGMVTVGPIPMVLGEYENRCCYGHRFGEFRGLMEFMIYIRRPDHLLEKPTRHSCFLSKGQLREHIESIFSILPSDFIKKFEILEVEEDITWAVYFKAEGENLYYRILLTWIRMAYEFPYSLILTDAFRLRSYEKFKGLSDLNRFRIASLCYPHDTNYLWREDQTMTHYGKLMNNSTLVEEINQYLNDEVREHTYLSDVFDKETYSPSKLVKISSESNLKSIRYWMSDEVFLVERLKYHRSNLKEILSKTPDIYEQ